MKAIIFVLALCGALGSPAFAQDGSKPAEGDKFEGRERPGRGMRHKFRKAMREKFKDMTPEEREAAKAKAKERLEEFRKKREEMKAKWEAMTPEEKEAAKAQAKARFEEMRAKFNELRERLKDMTPEQRKEELKKLREQWKQKRADRK